MFADDAKILRQIKNENYSAALQGDLDKIYAWSQKWQLDSNTNKCSVLQLGESQKRICATYKLGGQELKNVDKEKDLGVTINKNLDPKDHINNIVGRAYAWWANIRVAFSHFDEEMVKTLITQYLRPSLEYVAVVWNSNKSKDILKLEWVQKAVIR